VPDVVDDDLTHGPSRQRKEVLAVDETQTRALSQFQIHLVNKSGRSQRLAGPTLCELPSRQPSQVLVSNSEELVRRVGITLAPGGEKLLDVAGHYNQFRMFSRSRLAQIFTSSNPLISWLWQLDALRSVA
jgi:hypothetical protein